MDTVALVVLLVTAVAAMTVVVFGRWTNPVSNVADEISSPLPVAAVESLVTSLLTSSPKVDVAMPFPGTYTLSYRTTPLFAIFLAIFAFPIGLLALWFVHEKQSLTVSITSEGDGSRVRVVGRAHKKLALALGDALRIQLKGLPAGSRP